MEMLRTRETTLRKISKKLPRKSADKSGMSLTP